MESVLQTEKKCFLCGNAYVHKHHVFGGSGKRSISEKRGLFVYLCPTHHNMGDEGVHFNRPLDLSLKCLAQTFYEDNYGNRQDFIKEFGKSYL